MGKQFTALLYGWTVIFGLILVASVLIALLLRFTTFNEPSLTWVTLVIGLISLFLGGLAAGVKGKEKGWIIGGITGAGFTLFTFLLQYLGYSQGFTLEQALHHGGYVLAALIGGILGVNIAKPENE
ncbi:TIGR04086 family membrane protein [Virgibacillus sediminis]|uniref:TIGR04086 family membrane protein n=1 Tax=Virgibacillus sediminis TaxID=202260 RepID=A0ABV7A618_9BACI